MTNQHGDFIWYELITSDIEAAQKFYGPLMGWSFSDSGQQDHDYRIFSINGNDVGGFMARPDGAEIPPSWMGYINVDDVDASTASIREAGGSIHMEPQDIADVGRFAFVADPQGVMFYIMQPTPDNPDETSNAFAATKPQDGHCAWNELATTDQAGATAFYADQFGWEQKEEMDMGPMGTYAFFHQGTYMIGAVMTKPDEMPVAAWTYYFRVKDIDAAVETIKANGGKILLDPTEIPGGEFQLNAMDPQGASFALIGQRK
ncbi:VOC family protein [Parasphingorhabdus sp. JC815]|uniref:VOC family protein n=1 Tax=Parasphingorhabdus sp. JC815 TaxID=3232140 RepID=UPI003457BE2A